MTRAAVAIFQKNGRILVCQRKKNSRYALKWEFPGGKVETGESVEECIKREVREELGVNVETIGRTKSQVNHFDDGGVFEVTYCFILKFSGKPVNNSFEEIRWVTISELQSLDILEANKSFIATLDENIFR